MSNYNKVKTEGVEEAIDLLHEVIQHTPIKIEETNGNEYDKGYIHYQDMVVETVKEQESKFQKLFSTYAEKLHKATLEDVLEFLGEDEEDSMFMSSAVVAKNSLRRKIRDYIKTLTK